MRFRISFLFLCWFVSTINAEPTKHPEFINCQLPGAENTVVVFNNSTLQRCVGRTLNIEYCMADIINNQYHCVKEGRVRQTIDEATGFKGMVARGYYLAGSDKKFVDCVRLKEGRPDSLFKSAYKLKCLTDMGENVLAKKNENELCLMGKHKAIYIEDLSVYFCDNNRFKLQKCMTKQDDKYKCLPKSKIEKVLSETPSLQATFGSSLPFCEEFFTRAGSLYPNYSADLEDCNAPLELVADLPVPITTTTTATKQPAAQPPVVFQYPQKPPAVRARPPVSVDTASKPVIRPIVSPFRYPEYISCHEPYMENMVVVQNNLTWQQCIGGRLELISCISSLEDSSYYCIDSKKIKYHADVTLKQRDNYLGKNPRNPVNCSSVMQQIKETEITGFTQEWCVGDNAIKSTDGEYDNDLCLLEAGGFYVEGSNFYACNGGKLELSKCVVLYNRHYQCVSKVDVEIMMEMTSTTSYQENDPFCSFFLPQAENLMSRYGIIPEDCNDMGSTDGNNHPKRGRGPEEYDVNSANDPEMNHESEDLTENDLSSEHDHNAAFPPIDDEHLSGEEEILHHSDEPKLPSLTAEESILEGEEMPHHLHKPTPPSSTTEETIPEGNFEIEEPRAEKHSTRNERIPEPEVPEDPRNCKLTEPDFVGKCIHIDDFLDKVGSVPLGKMHEHIDWGKTLTLTGNLAMKMMKMTPNQIFAVVDEVSENAGQKDQIGPETVFDLARTLIKKDANDCELLLSHAIMHKQYIYDLMKNCTEA